MSVEQPQVKPEQVTPLKQETENDVERLKATNARLLEESQSYKDKFKTALKEKEELEAKKIAESGDIAAQLDLANKRAKKFEDELGQTKKKVVTQAVKDKISKYAGDVYSLDEIMSKPSLKEFLRQGLDEDSLDFNDESAKAFVDEVKKESPHLWRSQGPIGAHTAKPNGGVGVTGTNVDISKMSVAEMKEYMTKNFK
jgi:hypothetical protein